MIGRFKAHCEYIKTRHAVGSGKRFKLLTTSQRSKFILEQVWIELNRICAPLFSLSIIPRKSPYLLERSLRGRGATRRFGWAPCACFGSIQTHSGLKTFTFCGRPVGQDVIVSLIVSVAVVSSCQVANCMHKYVFWVSCG